MILLGLIGIVKVLLSMESGLLPAQLHYNTPNENIPGLLDGRMQVVTTNTPWTHTLVGISSFGFGGANGHAILEGFPDNYERIPHPASDVRRLLTCCGRTYDAVEHLLARVTSHPHDVFLHRLLQENANDDPSRFPYRGCTLLNDPKSLPVIQVITP